MPMQNPSANYRDAPMANPEDGALELNLVCYRPGLQQIPVPWHHST